MSKQFNTAAEISQAYLDGLLLTPEEVYARLETLQTPLSCFEILLLEATEK